MPLRGKARERALEIHIASNNFLRQSIRSPYHFVTILRDLE
jgi:hypothetical protein